MITQSQLKKQLKYNDTTGEFHWCCNKQGVTKGNVAGRIVNCNNLYYITLRIDNKDYLAHRMVFLYKENKIPKEVDHTDGNTFNNRWLNLESVSHKQNMRNQAKSKNNSSNVTGVSFHKKSNKWRAFIRINNKQKHLGIFVDKSLAIIARKNAEKKYGYHINTNRKKVTPFSKSFQI